MALAMAMPMAKPNMPNGCWVHVVPIHIKENKMKYRIKCWKTIDWHKCWLDFLIDNGLVCQRYSQNYAYMYKLVSMIGKVPWIEACLLQICWHGRGKTLISIFWKHPSYKSTEFLVHCLWPFMFTITKHTA